MLPTNKYDNSTFSKLRNVSTGRSINSVPLNSILGNYKNVAVKCTVAVKSDIEGDEFIIFNKDTNLTNVYMIQLEYHPSSQYSYDDLKMLFEDKKFKVDSGETLKHLYYLFAIKD